ncbi:1-deoxy-D-xylulose 5-phosphate reductoisomerase [Roseovarius nanhaiticus]|uniref:1-deoxy-D-xylulose 5-phosphate reductoisomerase n=1 Tax=Roseovarius nanhaiticus TaxID=573024 RepID=A0A1N7HI27_9RHOB|nr:1-deoxy-D-xylulose-5-phosphate reductoisomerase [Roseovarius nanhaiticus]SEK93308.1 1-deoxy-D-xylulose 5-phosphate reductoisomerase [Roseovarius nanhaiticus]SIS24462.1 1-deoxy-D-xylulose 5-phosphate reductoisomerase [Roseovarius nanhaiticus]
MRRVTILGATGSIGQNTLDLIRRTPEAYQVVALTGGQNIAQLAQDACEFGAELAVTADRARLSDLRAALDGSGIAAAAGPEALIEAAARPADWVMSAIVGVAGLAPGLAALGQGATLALANKESLVTAGPLMLATAAKHDATILPVDSEHSAIFQALVGEDRGAVERVVITASGGAFRDRPLSDLAHVTVAEASTHPNWDMGQRITIDSASMFNKALEVIEAKEFFCLTPDQIEVLVHPQSTIHALVGFVDGALMAHVGPPDMRHAIGYALNWPARRALPVERLDLAALGRLDFHHPDPARYPALALARQVMEAGGHSGAVFNAAKERALDHFIAGRIGFAAMSDLVARCLEEVGGVSGQGCDTITLESVGRWDHLTRHHIDRIVSA